MAQKSESSKAVDFLLQGPIKSYLKSEGFRKNGRTFYRTNDNLIQVINCQTSWTNTPEEARFTINLNVVLPYYHEKWTGQPVPRNPGSAAAICSYRLGHLLPERKDRWWSVSSAGDAERVSPEIEEFIKSVGVPHLNKMSNLEVLSNCLGAEQRFPGIVANQRLAYAILLYYLGRREEARRAIGEVRNKNRMKAFTRTIDKVEERLGIASNKAMESDA